MYLNFTVITMYTLFSQLVFIEPNQKLLKSPEQKVVLTQSKSEK